MRIKNIIIGGAGLIVFALLFLLILNLNGAIAFSVNSQTNKIQEKVIKQNNVYNEGYQEAVLSMRNWEYVVTPSVLKKGVPVKMIVDLNTVVGCAQDVTIKAFGVRKYVKTGDNIIEFIPTKTGIINIACSMNMFHGKFQVVDDTTNLLAKSSSEAINVNTQISVPPNNPGSCGMNYGGCGCMRRF